MIRAVDSIPAVILVIATCAFLLLFRMKLKAQATRLELAKKGKLLLARQDLPATAHRELTFWLDHAFGTRMHLIACIVAMPVAVPVWAFFPESRHDSRRDVARSSKRTRELYAETSKLTSKLMFANNPILTVLAAVIMLIVLVVTFVPFWVLPRLVVIAAVKLQESRVLKYLSKVAERPSPDIQRYLSMTSIDVSNIARRFGGPFLPGRQAHV